MVRLFGDLIATLTNLCSIEPKSSIIETSPIISSSFSHEMISFFSKGLTYDSSVLQSQLAQEEKEIVEQIVQLFILLEIPIFSDVISSNCENMYRAITSVPALSMLLQVLLVGPGGPEVSKITLLHSLRWLSKNIFGGNELAQTMNINVAARLQRILKLMLMALGAYPEEIENIWAIFLPELILSCLRCGSSKTSQEPVHALLLLRTLFRAIGGGRFESLYREILPILPTILETLNALLYSIEVLQTSSRGNGSELNTSHLTMSSSPQPMDLVKDLVVELALTIPVRLSVLLPYLSLLMKPLVYSLKVTNSASMSMLMMSPAPNGSSHTQGGFPLQMSTIPMPAQTSTSAPMMLNNGAPSSSAFVTPDLFSQGLRTLELCIDNLTQDFLDPILSTVMPDLLEALWAHCRPLPYPSQFAHTALRILGKLAGRNKRLARQPTFKSHPTSLLQLPSDVQHERAFMYRLISQWNELLWSPMSQYSFHKRDATFPSSPSNYLPCITRSYLEDKMAAQTEEVIGIQMRYFAYFSWLNIDESDVVHGGERRCVSLGHHLSQASTNECSQKTNGTSISSTQFFFSA